VAQKEGFRILDEEPRKGKAEKMLWRNSKGKRRKFGVSGKYLKRENVWRRKKGGENCASKRLKKRREG